VTFDLEAARASGLARLAAEKAARAAGKPSPPATVIASGEGQEAPISFQARSVGLSVEVEAVRRVAPGQWELNLGSEFSRLRAPGKAPVDSGAAAAVSVPRAQQFNISSMQLFTAGKTVLASTSKTAGKGENGAKAVMLFVKVLE
jgi:hypothetical protein